MNVFRLLEELRCSEHFGLLVHHSGRENGHLYVDLVGYVDGGPRVTYSLHCDDAIDEVMGPVEEMGWDYIPTMEWQSRAYLAVLKEIHYQKTRLLNPRPNNITCLLDNCID